MSANPQSLVEADRPPAGTPCIVCKGNGHWCQADQYTAGDSGNGICNACAEGIECLYRAMRKKRDLTFEPQADEPPAAPVRIVPTSQAVLIPEKPRIELPAVTTSQPDGIVQRFEAIAERLLKLDPGETVLFATPAGLTVKSFETALLDFLSVNPSTKDINWIHHPDPTKTKLIMATMKTKGVTKAKTEAPPVKLEQERCGCGRLKGHKEWCTVRREVDTYKPDQKTQAEGMLRAGYGTQAVQDRTGLARNTVIKIKRELGLPVGVQPAAVPESPNPEPPKFALKPSGSQQWTPIVDELLRLNVGDWINLKVAEGWGLDRYANNLRTYLNNDPRSKPESWSIQIHGFNGKVHVTRNGPKSPKVKPDAAPENREAAIAAPTLPPKPELKVAMPVTIVTVPADAPKADMTLSRAFEMVMAELKANIENLRDMGGDEDIAAAIGHDEDILATLHDYHPAFMGSVASGPKVSVYQRAMESAESELKLINLEIQRLTTRRDALKPMLDAMKAGIAAERETR